MSLLFLKQQQHNTVAFYVSRESLFMQLCYREGVIIPILQMRRLRPKWIKGLLKLPRFVSEEEGTRSCIGINFPSLLSQTGYILVTYVVSDITNIYYL